MLCRNPQRSIWSRWGGARFLLLLITLCWESRRRSLPFCLLHLIPVSFFYSGTFPLSYDKLCFLFLHSHIFSYSVLSLNHIKIWYFEFFFLSYFPSSSIHLLPYFVSPLSPKPYTLFPPHSSYWSFFFFSKSFFNYSFVFLLLQFYSVVSMLFNPSYQFLIFPFLDSFTPFFQTPSIFSLLPSCSSYSLLHLSSWLTDPGSDTRSVSNSGISDVSLWAMITSVYSGTVATMTRLFLLTLSALRRLWASVRALSRRRHTGDYFSRADVVVDKIGLPHLSFSQS